VAVCLYDPQAGVGGMLHALLPAAPSGKGTQNTPTKFAQQGIPLLVDAVKQLGAKPSRIIVQIFGGAHMLSAPGFKNSLNIGERNVEMATAVLAQAGFKIHAQVTGGQVGRTVRLRVVDGQTAVKSRGKEEIITTA
jgi:chemotaxis protein CheD